MRDKDIVKALECCISDNCISCPHYEDNVTDCMDKSKADALDLINRQQEKIERLKDKPKQTKVLNRKRFDLYDELATFVNRNGISKEDILAIVPRGHYDVSLFWWAERLVGADNG